MSAMNTLKKFGLEQAFNYVYKDPDKNFIKIMDWADKFSGGGFPTQRAMIRAAISNPEHPYYPFIHRLAVISRGQSFLTQQVHVTCTVQDAGQQSMETS